MISITATLLWHRVPHNTLSVPTPLTYLTFIRCPRISCMVTATVTLNGRNFLGSNACSLSGGDPTGGGGGGDGAGGDEEVSFGGPSRQHAMSVNCSYTPNMLSCRGRWRGW